MARDDKPSSGQGAGLKVENEYWLTG